MAPIAHDAARRLAAVFERGLRFSRRPAAAAAAAGRRPAPGGGTPYRFRVVPVGSLRRAVDSAAAARGSARGAAQSAVRHDDLDFLVVVPARTPLDRVGVPFLAGKPGALRQVRGGDAVRRVALPAGAAWPGRGDAAAKHRGPRGRRPRGQSPLASPAAEADLIFARPAALPFALFHYTGPRSYNIRTRKRAADRGYRLNQYGLFDRRTGRAVPGLRTEAAIARFLGLTVRRPADRR